MQRSGSSKLVMVRTGAVCGCAARWAVSGVPAHPAKARSPSIRKHVMRAEELASGFAQPRTFEAPIATSVAQNSPAVRQ